MTDHYRLKINGTEVGYLNSFTIGQTLINPSDGTNLGGDFEIGSISSYHGAKNGKIAGLKAEIYDIAFGVGDDINNVDFNNINYRPNLQIYDEDTQTITGGYLNDFVASDVIETTSVTITEATLDNVMIGNGPWLLNENTKYTLSSGFTITNTNNYFILQKMELP